MSYTTFFQLYDGFNSEVTLEMFLLMYRWPALGLLYSTDVTFFNLICFTENIHLLIDFDVMKMYWPFSNSSSVSLRPEVGGEFFISKEVHQVIA